MDPWEREETMEMMSGTMLAALIGVAGGLALGVAARVGRFCTLGAIEDALYGGSGARLRMWGAALGLSILGCAGLTGAGLLVPAEVFLVRDGFSPVAVIFGGTLFGFGMALAGNCGYGALARLGNGDIRAFVLVGVLGVTAYAALFGPLSGLRLWIFELPVLRFEAAVTLDALIGGVLSVPPWAVGVGAGIGLLAVALHGAEARGPVLRWGAVVAAAIVSGWAGTGYLAQTSFEVIGVRSHNFSAPLGETLAYFMLSDVRPLSFAVGSVLGVVAGSVLGSLWLGQFRWEACEDPRELKRQLMGAVFMGFGATLALGCSIGQGLSAFAILTVSAPLAAASIFAGAALGLRVLIEGWPVGGSRGI
ncbi:YeeE/YedE family protein [Dinoroseobacter sp. PD6]|uniref:YeeE/YedE family protein n=1 Tax=Dinoroseobacter sp. PD6 TaxID=3028384 RepID=UPI00237A1524|nr:YeeE/YedE family protein [Dinoroseobacter sp. PD6]MDD9717012.1 YeeE/YedE family protein [Dinoroseobacter sp. PD6]